MIPFGPPGGGGGYSTRNKHTVVDTFTAVNQKRKKQTSFIITVDHWLGGRGFRNRSTTVREAEACTSKEGYARREQLLKYNTVDAIELSLTLLVAERPGLYAVLAERPLCGALKQSERGWHTIPFLPQKCLRLECVTEMATKDD